MNFFRVCQWHYEELVRYLRYCLVSRKLHELHLKTDPGTLTDIQRAGRFFYLQKNSFGGLILKQKFHYGVTQPSNYNPERIPEIIEQTHQRLQRVQIESLPYEQVLEKYDRPTTVFYLDPPYWERKALQVQLHRHSRASSFSPSTTVRKSGNCSRVPNADGRAGLHRQARHTGPAQGVVDHQFRSLNWKWMSRLESPLSQFGPAFAWLLGKGVSSARLASLFGTTPANVRVIAFRARHRARETSAEDSRRRPRASRLPSLPR